MKRKIDIVIINGKPRSGKDTVIKYMRRYCNYNECAYIKAYSTIDPVKLALNQLGWNGEKTDDVRNLLAALKQFWVNSCDGPLKYCVDKIIDAVNADGNDDYVLIFQIREPAEIDKLINAIKPISKAYDLNVSTLFVERFPNSEDVYGNSADANVGDFAYDAKIVNTGTLDQLEKLVEQYMDKLLGRVKHEADNN